MTADNRSPVTDALATLGMIHTQTEKRDAIHLGVEPVEAGEDLLVGEHVGLFEGKAFSKRGGIAVGHKLVGIVDPFLPRHPGFVHKGERFWLIVYPHHRNDARNVDPWSRTHAK